jgi:tetratricopeptide (TPR) repeat protein
MSSLYCSPWTVAQGAKDVAALCRVVPAHLIPALYGLAGLSWFDSEDEGAAELQGQLSSDDQGYELTLTLKTGEQEQSKSARLKNQTASQLFQVIYQLLSELGLLEKVCADEQELVEQWSRCFGSMALKELQCICDCFEDVVAASTASLEGEARVIKQFDQSQESSLRGAFIRIVVGNIPKVRPIFARSLTLLGIALGNFSLAEQGYVAMKVSGSGASALLRARVALHLAHARLEREHPEGYQALIKQAVELAPEDPVVNRMQATARMMQKDFEGALELYNTLTERQSDPRLLYGKAHALSSLNRLEEALDCYRSVLEALEKDDFLSPEKDLVSGVLGEMTALMVSEGKHDELSQLSSQYAPIFSQRPKLINVLATSLLMSFKYEEAGQLLDQNLKIAPDSALTHTLKARSLLPLDRAEEAIDFVRKAVELEPEQDMWRISLAEVLVEAKQHDEASQLFQELSKKESGLVSSGVYMMLIARKHEDDNDLEKAEEWYQSALGAYGESHLLRSEYGAFLIARDRPSEAIDLLSTLLELAPRFTRGMKNLQTALLLVLQSQEISTVDRDRCQALLVRVHEVLASY